MPLDMLDRLCMDPGTRTLGELMQEREWAAWEIRRLRRDVAQLSRKREARRIEGEMEQTGGLDPKLNAQRLLRLAEVSTTVGLKRSAGARIARPTKNSRSVGPSPAASVKSGRPLGNSERD
jgi:hypothetical protein